MKTIRVVLGLGFLALALASCTVMSPQECKFANWREIGLIDGMAGKLMRIFEERRSDCAEANVKADTNDYLLGREQGLRTYCQMSNALQIGLRGESYQGVCPAAIDQEFRRRHDIGYDVHYLREEIARLESRYGALEKGLRSKKIELDKLVNEPGKNDDFKHKYREFQEEERRVREEQNDIERNRHRAGERLRQAEWAMSQLS
jgi:Protein of unknown function (DUF2799)